MTSDGQDSRHFLKGAVPIVHIAQTEGDSHNVEAGIRKWKLTGVGEDGGRDAFAARDLQHFGRKIRRDDLGRWESSREGESEIAAAGGEIENTPRLPLPNECSRAVTPPVIEAAAEEVIPQVVTPCDAAKHRPDFVGVALE